MPQLIKVTPNQATPAEEDDLAIALYDADSQQPWKRLVPEQLMHPHCAVQLLAAGST